MKCSNCGKVFNPSDYQIKQFNNGKNVFCSKSCGTAFRYKSNYIEITDEELAEKLQNMFDTTDLSYDEIKKISGVSYSRFSNVVKKYNIGRSEERITELKISHCKETMLKKYGDINPMRVNVLKESFKKSRKKSKEDEALIVKKREQTKLERYGDKDYHNVKQMKQTVQERYGVNSGFNTEFARQRHKEVSLEKYGVDNPFKSEEVHNLQKQSMKEKYGGESAFSVPEIREKAKQTNLKKYGVDNPMKNKIVYNNTVVSKLIKHYGVTNGFATPQCIKARYKNGSTSNINFNIGNQLNENNDIQYEFHLDGYLYDIKKGKKFLIEVDPTVSHNINKSYAYIVGISKNNKPIDINYHYEKTKNALKNHYKCIHIFDWDDIEKIKYIIEDKQKDYANNYSIKEVNLNEAEKFLDDYSITNIKGSSIYLGLFKNDNLYQLIGIGKHLRSTKWEYEIFNFQTSPNYEIIGGYEKLIKYFIKNYKPKSICTYVDISKFTRKEFEQIGFLYRKTIKPKLWIYENKIKKQVYENYKDINQDWLPVPDCGYYLMYYKVK